MTDLESACRELVEEWKERTETRMAEIDTTRRDYTGNFGSLCMGMRIAANELEETLEEHTPDAADKLAAKTGEPREKFEADDKPIPDLDDLNSEVKELVDTMEDAT